MYVLHSLALTVNGICFAGMVGKVTMLVSTRDWGSASLEQRNDAMTTVTYIACDVMWSTFSTVWYISQGPRCSVVRGNMRPPYSGPHWLCPGCTTPLVCVCVCVCVCVWVGGHVIEAKTQEKFLMKLSR